MAGVSRVQARSAAKGLQDPDFMEGAVDTLGCVSLRSPHLLAVPLSAPGKWEILSLDIKNAFPRADGFSRDVFLLAPDESEPRRLSADLYRCTSRIPQASRLRSDCSTGRLLPIPVFSRFS